MAQYGAQRWSRRQIVHNFLNTGSLADVRIALLIEQEKQAEEEEE